LIHSDAKKGLRSEQAPKKITREGYLIVVDRRVFIFQHRRYHYPVQVLNPYPNVFRSFSHDEESIEEDCVLGLAGFAHGRVEYG
jgi:hypothetical protein